MTHIKQVRVNHAIDLDFFLFFIFKSPPTSLSLSFKRYNFFLILEFIYLTSNILIKIIFIYFYKLTSFVEKGKKNYICI